MVSDFEVTYSCLCILGIILNLEIWASVQKSFEPAQKVIPLVAEVFALVYIFYNEGGDVKGCMLNTGVGHSAYASYLLLVGSPLAYRGR